MSAPSPLPDAIKRVQISLSPFVRQRQEADHIRRVLAVHLSRHINPNIQDGDLLPRPLSLLLSEDVDISSSGFRGNRKEYVRCVRANIKARKEYSKIRREHQPQRIPDIQRTREGKSKIQEVVPDLRVSLDPFLDLVRKRRKHERLRIIQDYVDMLSQKPAASPHHLDLPTVLKDTHSLPQMPPEVLATVGPSQEVAQTNIKDLVDRLERSVLRAKILLQREQKLLAKARDTTTSFVTSSVPKNRLQALGTTRNELINWIETELGKASDDNSEPTDVGQTSTTTSKRNKHIESQVALIWRQYSHYTSARQKLILAVAEQGPPPIAPTAAGKEPYLDEEQKQNSKTTSHITSQYLGGLLCVSNDQKSAIQQKSHLTISMSKQLKEAGQGTDRLAHESHLLPTYPMPPNFHQRKEMDTSISFATEIARNEKPDSSRRARAWVYAAQAAETAMKDAILENLDEGESAVTGASKALSDLQTLLGLDVTKGKDGEHQNIIGDMWAVLDGHLGAIKTDDP